MIQSFGTMAAAIKAYCVFTEARATIPVKGRHDDYRVRQTRFASPEKPKTSTKAHLEFRNDPSYPEIRKVMDTYKPVLDMQSDTLSQLCKRVKHLEELIEEQNFTIKKQSRTIDRQHHDITVLSEKFDQLLYIRSHQSNDTYYPGYALSTPLKNNSMSPHKSILRTPSPHRTSRPNSSPPT